MHADEFRWNLLLRAARGSSGVINGVVTGLACVEIWLLWHFVEKLSMPTEIWKAWVSESENLSYF